jgi:hypothetical protein
MPDVQDVLIPLSVLSHIEDLSMCPNYPVEMGHISAVDEMWLLLYLHLNTKPNLTEDDAVTNIKTKGTDILSI